MNDARQILLFGFVAALFWSFATPFARADDHAPDAHHDEVTLSEVAIRHNGIRIATVQRRNLSASVLAPARVAFDADAIAHVGTAVEGRVIEARMRLGDVVKAGDVLLVIESPELGSAQSEYLLRRVEKTNADAAVEPARDAYRRVKQLLDESQGIALSEVQRREAEQRTAIASAATAATAASAAEGKLHLLGMDAEAVKRLANTGAIEPTHEVRAAIDGRVIHRHATLGELVSPEDEALYVIADTAHVWVLADVPESRLADVGDGSIAEIRFPSSPDALITAPVASVAAQLDPATRTAQVRIVVDNSDGRLRPGMFASALIQAREVAADKGVLALPESAVLTVENEPSVFVPVADEPNTFSRRTVTVGRPVKGYVPVLAGLDADESVVVSGAFILKAELGKSEAAHEH